MMVSLQNAHEERDEQVHEIIQHTHAQKTTSMNTSHFTQQQHSDVVSMIAELKKDQ
jgi:hypothetical protein